MSNIDRMYARPSSPFSFSPEELARMREDVVHAEAEAARATSWGQRTRWEQEAKSLRGLIRGGEIEAALTPVTAIGQPATAGQNAENNRALTFDQLARLIEDARKAGVVASYDLRRPRQTA